MGEKKPVVENCSRKNVLTKIYLFLSLKKVKEVLLYCVEFRKSNHEKN